jgi:hypothetical protein
LELFQMIRDGSYPMRAVPVEKEPMEGEGDEEEDSTESANQSREEEDSGVQVEQSVERVERAELVPPRNRGSDGTNRAAKKTPEVPMGDIIATLGQLTKSVENLDRGIAKKDKESIDLVQM